MFISFKTSKHGKKNIKARCRKIFLTLSSLALDTNVLIKPEVSDGPVNVVNIKVNGPHTDTPFPGSVLNIP